MTSDALPDSLLVLEAATRAGSVAMLHRRGAASPWTCERHVDVPMGSGRDDHLTPAVVRVLTGADGMVERVGGVVCGDGPGSFTSLRIAASLAKGLAMAWGCPLYAVSSMLLAVPEDAAPGPVVITMDALRGERFHLEAEVLTDGFVIARGEVMRVSADAPTALPASDTAPASGHAAVARATPVSIDVEQQVVPRASRVLTLGALRTLAPVDLDAWEPSYGRLAEAQVQWERTHGRPLPSA